MNIAQKELKDRILSVKLDAKYITREQMNSVFKKMRVADMANELGKVIIVAILETRTIEYSPLCVCVCVCVTVCVCACVCVCVRVCLRKNMFSIQYTLPILFNNAVNSSLSII